MVDDSKLWREVKERITHKITNADFKIMCKLHSKHFNHKYYEPCTCNKGTLRQWLTQLNKKLI
tara:strand:+ start:45 stop:233 length:189 start_codon:yes stop_codon:yes gene_type:complete